MTRDEYECLQALRFGLPIKTTDQVWFGLINKGWILPPTLVTSFRVTEFIISDAGEQALGEFR